MPSPRERWHEWRWQRGVERDVELRAYEVAFAHDVLEDEAAAAMAEEFLDVPALEARTQLREGEGGHAEVRGVRQLASHGRNRREVRQVPSAASS